jgi:hypothetical protein
VLSNAQVDRLGDRLREGQISEDDLVLLDEHRRVARSAYERVVERLRSVGLAPTGRPGKSTRSVVDKLQRENIRLSQMQDIAGCRVVVTDIAQQTRQVSAISRMFERVAIADRRAAPSNGYRAVHFIVRDWITPVEIQLRTTLQHTWAEVSEKLADMHGTNVKYGKGPADVLEPLASFSRDVESFENVALRYVEARALVEAKQRGIHQDRARTSKGSLSPSMASSLSVPLRQRETQLRLLKHSIISVERAMNQAHETIRRNLENLVDVLHR